LRVITRWALTPLVYGVKKEQGTRDKVQGERIKNNFEF